MSLRTANVHLNIFYLYTKLHIYKNGRRLFWLLSTYLLFNIYSVQHSRSNWDPPPPHPQASVFPPLIPWGETLACGRGGGAWTNELQRHRTLYVAFSLSWPVNRLCGILFNRFYRLEIHSLSGLYFRPSLWTVAPMDEGTILVYCCPSTFSLTSFHPTPPPSQTKCTLFTNSMWLWGGGGGVLNCTVDNILQEFYTLFLTRFRTYKIASLPPKKWPVKTTLKVVSNGTGGGCEWYQLIGLNFLYISADSKKFFKGPRPFKN